MVLLVKCGTDLSKKLPVTIANDIGKSFRNVLRRLQVTFELPENFLLSLSCTRLPRLKQRANFLDASLVLVEVRDSRALIIFVVGTVLRAAVGATMRIVSV